MATLPATEKSRLPPCWWRRIGKRRQNVSRNIGQGSLEFVHQKEVVRGRRYGGIDGNRDDIAGRCRIARRIEVNCTTDAALLDLQSSRRGDIGKRRKNSREVNGIELHQVAKRSVRDDECRQCKIDNRAVPGDGNSRGLSDAYADRKYRDI